MLKKASCNVYRLKHCGLSQTDTQMRACEETDGRNRAFNQEWTLTCSSFPQEVQNQYVSYLRLRRLSKGVRETLLLDRAEHVLSKPNHYNPNRGHGN